MGKCNRAQTFRPHVDETPVPCDTYSTTDCVYASENVCSLGLEVAGNPSLTDVINALNEKIEKLEKQIFAIKQGINLRKEESEFI